MGFVERGSIVVLPFEDGLVHRSQDDMRREHSGGIRMTLCESGWLTERDYKDVDAMPTCIECLGSCLHDPVHKKCVKCGADIDVPQLHPLADERCFLCADDFAHDVGCRSINTGCEGDCDCGGGVDG